MATYEHDSLLQYKDQNGDMHITYPITKAENVDGLYEGPTLTGVPKAPTAAKGTNTDQIATTKFVQTGLADKVDAVSGKGLSTNDYTTAEKEKLSGIATGANKTVVDTALSSTSTNPVQNKAVNAALATKVDAVSGKGLSTNDYTTAEKEKLSGIAAGANKTVVDSALSSTSTNPVQNKAVNAAIENLKKSVSDGKSAVAAAITGKGVDTAADATFAVMATNIEAIETGGGLTFNVFTQETEPETKEGIWIQTANPHKRIVVVEKTYTNTEVDNPNWVRSVDTPYEARGSAESIVYDGKLHILGGSSGSTKHYAFDGTSWSSVSTLPYAFFNGCAVVYAGKLHILGADSNRTKHYAFDGTSWSSVSTLPFSFNAGCAVVYAGKLHILGGLNGSTKHYAFDGTSWSSVSTLPYHIYSGNAVVYKNKIHILGGLESTSDYTKHYAFDGTSWSSVGTLPFGLYYGGAITYADKIHILAGQNNGDYTKHYAFDGTSWSSVSTLPYRNAGGNAVVYKNKIHILGCGFNDDYNFNKHYILSLFPEEYNATTIAIYQNPSNTSGTYVTNFISGVPITGENNKFPSGFDDVYYINDSENVEESPTYYGDGTQWIKFKN